jgi:hypothetical protein
MPARVEPASLFYDFGVDVLAGSVAADEMTSTPADAPEQDRRASRVEREQN